MNIRLKSSAIILSVFIAQAFHPLVAQADETAQAAQAYNSAQERINFSGKLRMLSQRIPSAACHLNRDIATQEANALLRNATAEFEQILTGLEFGDASLDIQGEETRRMTLWRINVLREKWEPLKATVDRLAEGTATEADLTYIFTENMSVLMSAQLLVEELVKQYSNPNGATQASLMLIDISGRQRMLTQKISKEACMLGSSFEIADTKDSIAGTVGIFEASLEALRFGMPSVGLGAPPNAQISTGLDGVYANWSEVKPLVSDAMAGAPGDAAAQTLRFQQLNTTMANMNKVVGLYTGAAGGSS